MNDNDRKIKQYTFKHVIFYMDDQVNCLSSKCNIFCSLVHLKRYSSQSIEISDTCKHAFVKLYQQFNIVHMVSL